MKYSIIYQLRSTDVHAQQSNLLSQLHKYRAYSIDEYCWSCKSGHFWYPSSHLKAVDLNNNNNNNIIITIKACLYSRNYDDYRKLYWVKSVWARLLSSIDIGVPQCSSRLLTRGVVKCFIVKTIDYRTVK